MKDPVFTKYGHLYEREEIIRVIKKTGHCPNTRKPLSDSEIYPAYEVKSVIQKYCKLKRLALKKYYTGGSNGIK